MTRLNQVIAVEKGIKTKVLKNITELNKLLQKPALFDGFSKTWEKIDEESEQKANERKRVQFKTKDVLSEISDNMTELFDVTAQKDFANCDAKADVIVDGNVLLIGIPATYLLFLEKQLINVKTIVGNLPTLSTDEDWHLDTASSLYKTAAVQTRSTAKVQEPITLAAATEHHPAQTQLISKDVVIGHWQTTKQSGAAINDDKKNILKRVDSLLKAVKFAREEANTVTAKQQNVGDKVFSYLFS